MAAIALSTFADAVYFVNKSGFSKPTCYAWKGAGGAGNQNAAWPGVAMTKESYQLRGADVYSYTATDEWTNCIFSDNKENQTGNLTWESGQYYYEGEWYTREDLEKEEQPGGTIDEPDGEETTAGVNQHLASYYKTNPNGWGKKKTITVDGSLSDWSAEDIIAQGAANDDPRVYAHWAMHEVPVDLYALYAAYDDNNLYLAWEMTNVQDVVAKQDDYPLSQGFLFETQELPFFIFLDTKPGGGDGYIDDNGGTLWASDITYAPIVDRVITLNTKGGNSFVYGNKGTHINAKELYNQAGSGIQIKYGLTINSKTVYGINAAGTDQGRKHGDILAENEATAKWVDFNTKGHKSATMDFHYELSIPLSKLGTDAATIASRGLGVMLCSTFGTSAMDCLPRDMSMTDNGAKEYSADKSSTAEKEDADHITASFAYIGNCPFDPANEKDHEDNPGGEQAIENIYSSTKATKVLHEGQIFIIRDNATYDLMGARVK